MFLDRTSNDIKESALVIIHNYYKYSHNYLSFSGNSSATDVRENATTANNSDPEVLEQEKHISDGSEKGNKLDCVSYGCHMGVAYTKILKSRDS